MGTLIIKLATVVSICPSMMPSHQVVPQSRIESSGYPVIIVYISFLFTANTGPVLCPQCSHEGVEAGATIDADRFPDKAIKRLLGKQKVVCSYPGCQFKGLLLEYMEHEDACLMTPVTCPHCSCRVELPR